MKQFIIKLPEGTKLDELSAEIQAEISKAKGQFPSGLLVGSQPVNGYELKLIMCALSGPEFDEAMVSLGLDWVVVADESLTIDQSLIIPYMMDALAFDDQGDVTGSSPVNDVTDKLQTYSGRNWSY